MSASSLPAAPFWRTREWWRRVGSTTLGLLASSILGLVATVIAARSLGPSVMGILVLALSTSAVVARFLDFTLEEALVHYGSRYLVDDDYAGLSALIRVALLFDILLGIVVAAATVLAAPLLSSLLTGNVVAPRLIQLAALIPLTSAMDGVTRAVLMLARKPQLFGWAQASASLLRLVAVSIAVSVGGVSSILIAYAVASLGGSLIQGVLAWRIGLRSWSTQGPRRRLRHDVVEWAGRLARFGAFSSISTTVSSVSGSVASLALGRFSGARSVGLFSVALLPVTLAATGASPLRYALLPEQARLWAEGKIQLLRRAIRVYMGAAVLIGILAFVIGWFLLPWLVPALYSRRFSAAIFPAKILMTAAVASLAVGWGKTLAPAVGRPGTRALVNTVEFAMLVTLIVAFAGRGATGAAIAYSITQVVVAVVWVASVPLLLRARGTQTTRGKALGGTPPLTGMDDEW